MDTAVRCGKSGKEIGMDVTDIIVKDLCKSYGELRVLSRFSYRFRAGETTCIMGASGCGKTTLIHILLGITEADGGTVEGVPYGRLSAVFQEDRLCENLSAMANIRLVCSGRQGEQEMLRQAMVDIGLSDAFDKPVRELSGGMKRRVAILRALCKESQCIVMDEPLKGLDVDTKRIVASYIAKHVKGRTCIIITHDKEEIELLEAKELLRL